MRIINQYCAHEAGVRNLRKCLDRIFRKIVAKMEDKKLLSSSTTESATTIDVTSTASEVIKEYQVNTGNLERFLDVPPTDDHYYQGINRQLPIGSSNGLAYVDDGQGSVLKIQFVRREFNKPTQQPETKKSDEEGGASPANLPRGHGAHLTHTGRLGEVMKESVEVVKIAVFNFLVQNSLAPDFDKNSYHLHVPMGAIPKDGPSAGISLFSALTSIAINKPVVASIAMTGEITTLGEVIAIGGVREKLTACKNHQINKVILPLSNKKNVTKLPDEFKRGFTIFYVKDISQVYKICFDTEEQALRDGSSFEKLREAGIEIEKYEDDSFVQQLNMDEEAALVTKRNCIEELML